MSAFFASPHVQTALLASAVVALLSAATGYFVVVRASSFAGHAIADIGLTGGAAALLVGVAPLAGLLVFSVAAALSIGTLGDRARERDVATGLVLAVALGLGALFLHLQTRFANAQSALLFGSIFDADAAVVTAIVVVALGALGVLAILFRPLVFASVSADAARVAGVPTKALGLVFLATLAVAVAETAQVVGVLIATALLIGPAATAARLVREPLANVALASAIGIAQMWLAIGLAYASVAWTPGRGGWPISFFVPAFALVTYVVAYAATSANRRDRTRPARIPKRI